MSTLAAAAIAGAVAAPWAASRAVELIAPTKKGTTIVSGSIQTAGWEAAWGYARGTAAVFAGAPPTNARSLASLCRDQFATLRASHGAASAATGETAAPLLSYVEIEAIAHFWIGVWQTAFTVEPSRFAIAVRGGDLLSVTDQIASERALDAMEDGRTRPALTELGAALDAVFAARAAIVPGRWQPQLDRDSRALWAACLDLALVLDVVGLLTRPDEPGKSVLGALAYVGAGLGDWASALPSRAASAATGAVGSALVSVALSTPVLAVGLVYLFVKVGR